MTEHKLERDRAYDLLVDMILHSNLDPEVPLSERKLAETLQIGRMPVREALRDLARDGVLEVRIARGAFVKRLSLDDLREIYETRQALEGMAAVLAARRKGSRELSDIARRLAEIVDQPDRYAGNEIDDTGAEFHRAIFKAAKNEALRHTFEPLRLRFLIAFGLPRDHDRDDLLESVREHLLLFRAIEAGDEERAGQLMRQHLARGLEIRSRIFADSQKLNSPETSD